MNLALFPITALLLLLSGVGAPVHPGDARGSATALIKAIPGNAANVPLCQKTAFAHWKAGVDQATYTRPTASPANADELAVAGQFRPGGDLNRKAYRARFGFVEGAYQPQGPPRAAARMLRP